ELHLEARTDVCVPLDRRCAAGRSRRRASRQVSRRRQAPGEGRSARGDVRTGPQRRLLGQGHPRQVHRRRPGHPLGQRGDRHRDAHLGQPPREEVRRHRRPGRRQAGRTGQGRRVHDPRERRLRVEAQGLRGHGHPVRGRQGQGEGQDRPDQEEVRVGRHEQSRPLRRHGRPQGLHLRSRPGRV
ncbi:MAG: hypothetical protein AVDCRST_MAG53-1801, partial [uncultured Solirubrobacteraceae bacterium]